MSEPHRTRYAVDPDASEANKDRKCLVWTADATKVINVEHAEYISIQTHTTSVDGVAFDLNGGTLTVKKRVADSSIASVAAADFKDFSAGAMTVAGAGIQVVNIRTEGPIRELQFALTGSTAPNITITVAYR